MKRKLTRKYLKVYLLSIFVAVMMWLVLTYVFISLNSGVNTESPQYLIHTFEQYITYENDSVQITEEGREILKRNELWMQIIDDNGVVKGGYNEPAEAKDEYSVFEISDFVMNSNSLGNYTVFIKEFDSNGYGIILGCDSTLVSKTTIRFTGGIWAAMLESGMAFLCVLIVMGVCSGYLYSRSIANPMNEVIQNINRLEAGKELDIGSKNNIFQTVFDSLQKLKESLDSVEKEKLAMEKQRKEWISNISHDMKTPLSSIKGYAEIMEDTEYSVSESEMRQYAQTIGRNAEAIKGLIDELNFSRLLEDGKIQLKKEELNICSLLKDCVKEIPHEYNKGQISFEFEEEPLYVSVDRELMHRCLVNIICNAIVHNAYEVDILISCRMAEKAIIEISDNGCGLNKEDQENIFKRYYRGGKVAETKGSGLGLSIAKEIVEAHDGTIRVKSEEGNGCTFIICI